MGRFPRAAARLTVAGAVALVAGSMMLVGIAAQVLTTPAYADTAPFEMFCAGTPVGNLVLNDIVVSGSLSPASPAPGQQFSLDNFQMVAPLPVTVAQSAAAVGNNALSGTVTSTVEVSGATPSSMPTGALEFDATVPDPVPASGMQLDVPSSPITIGPFTATSSNIAVSLGSSTHFDIDDAGIALSLSCSAYPNDTIPSGFTAAIPPGLPTPPVIALAGAGSPPPPPPAVTGPYELYCPHTPVGDLALNDVVTSATVASSGLSAGDQFQVTGYQTHIPLPAGLAAAAAGLGNSSFDGLAASAVDVYGATPPQASTGSMPFDVAIPDPVPSGGLGLDVPMSPTTLGPFTATGGPITIAQDQSTLVVAALSSKAFKMSCTAYPNDSVPTSGSTGTAPTAPPIRPVIAVGSASGTTPTTTTTTVPSTGTPPPASGPFELYCPGSPVGDLVLNDTSASASISPSTLTEGQQFQLADLQMQFSIPQSVVQQAESLGLTQITGTASLFLNATGIEDYYGYGPGPIPIAVGSSGGGSVSVGSVTSVSSSSGAGGPAVLLPGPYPGIVDMPFNVTLPDPVPAGGVQFTATPGPDFSTELTAAGGPIEFSVGGVNLNVTEFGDSFGLFCDSFPNDTQPTGLTSTAPVAVPVQPVIATGDATIPPPTPVGPGAYELYCPGTPVGNIVLNDVTTSAALSPTDPTPGQAFQVTGYQTQVDLPPSVVTAAEALGNTAITGSATTTIGAIGATPASVASGTMDFSVPIPAELPAAGLELQVPSTPGTFGPFTASGSTVTITQGDQISLTLMGSGSDTAPSVTLPCTSYQNDAVPFSGITGVAPFGPPILPVIATTAPVTPPPGGPGAYELYCPGTPVGNIALNDVSTSGTISPADPSAGEQFQVTGYQTDVSLPSSIVSAAAALGNSAITGTATTGLDATGATPASLSSGSIAIDAPIPSPVPSSGLALELPSAPSSIGPFTASGGPVTITEDPTAALTLVVSGSDLSLTCRAYPDNSEPTGIVNSAPAGPAVSPVIATSPGGSSPPTTAPPAPPTTVVGTTTPPQGTTSEPSASSPSTTAPTSAATSATTSSTTYPTGSSTTEGPAVTDPATKSAGSGTGAVASVVTARSSSLAFTGPGGQLRWMGMAGVVLVLLGLAMLVLVDAPRRALRALAQVTGGRGRSAPAPPDEDLWYHGG